MKVLCPACERLCDFERFRVEGTSLFVTCARCGVEHLASSSASMASAAGAVSAPIAPVAPPTSTLSATEPAGEVPLPMASSPSSPQLRPLALVSSPNASNVVVLRTASTEAVEHAASSAKSGPFAVPADCCPKCLAKRQEASRACPQCGLVFAMLDPAVLEPPRWLAEAWKDLLTHWGDDQKHDQLRKRASQGDALAAVGRLYRMRLAWVAEDPWAQRGRDEVVRLASATGLQRMTPQGEHPASGRTKWVVALVLTALLGLAFAGFIKVIFTSRPGL